MKQKETKVKKVGEKKPNIKLNTNVYLYTFIS